MKLVKIWSKNGSKIGVRLAERWWLCLQTCWSGSFEARRGWSPADCSKAYRLHYRRDQKTWQGDRRRRNQAGNYQGKPEQISTATATSQS